MKFLFLFIHSICFSVFLITSVILHHFQVTAIRVYTFFAFGKFLRSCTGNHTIKKKILYCDTEHAKWHNMQQKNMNKPACRQQRQSHHILGHIGATLLETWPGLQYPKLQHKQNYINEFGIDCWMLHLRKDQPLKVTPPFFIIFTFKPC